jgi:hypothetical protein
MIAAQNVQIVGSGHSGSTLLDMILGGHSQISALGEAHFLHYNVRNHKKLDVCTCGLHVLECPFWSKVEEAARLTLTTDQRPALTALEFADPGAELLRNAEGAFRKPAVGEPYPFRSRANEMLLVLGSRQLRSAAARLAPKVRRARRYAADMVTLYDLVRKAHGTPIIVDSTKNPGTFKGIYLESDCPVRFILVARDGRAVCNSRMHREGVGMRDAARIWVAEHRKRKIAQLTIPKDRFLVIHYEDLTSEPETVVRGVCDFLEIQFEPGMLEFRQGRHNLGGNPMRFRKTETEIRTDERWKQQLTADDLAEFDRIAGPLNRSLGYRT